MSILNILLCVGVVNLISPAFGDIYPDWKYYNPVAAVLVHRYEPSKVCPGALVWVKHWQVFIESGTCKPIAPSDRPKTIVRVGGNAGGDTNGEETHRRLLHTTLYQRFGVRLIFFKGADTAGGPFPMTPRFMPGILQRSESDAKNELPITISRDTWGPHHEVSASSDGNDTILSFDEPLTSESGKCPEEVQWGPAMRPARWSVPLIVGLFKKSEKRKEENGVCKVQLRYTSIIPAVQWIENFVTEFYEGLSQFMMEWKGKTEEDYVAHFEKTQIKTGSTENDQE